MPQPVLFVPGLPGSHLRDASGKEFFLNGGTIASGGGNRLLEGPDDLGPQGDDGVRAGEPIKSVKILIFDVQKHARPLYRYLEKLGVRDLAKFGWDWRRPVWDDAAPFSVQNRLETAIRKLAQDAGQPITLIAHSTGGLVVRHLIEQRAQSVLPSIRRLISFGVPWAGVLRTLSYLSGTESFGGVIPPARVQNVMAHDWAGFDLIPPDLSATPGLDLVYREQNGNRVPVSLLTERDWLQNLPANLRASAIQRATAAAQRLAGRGPRIETGNRPLEVVNVVGWGFPTQINAVVTGAGPTMRVAVQPTDSNDPELDGGDGTVPRRSAAWLEGGGAGDVKTYHLPVGVLSNSRTRTHTSLWFNPGGRNLLSHLLKGDALEPFTYLALGKEALDSGGPNQITARAVALDSNGGPLVNARVELMDLTPGGNVSHVFDPAFDGRALFKVPRSRLRRRAGNHRVRTFTARFSWEEGGVTRTGDRQTFSFLESP